MLCTGSEHTRAKQSVFFKSPLQICQLLFSPLAKYFQRVWSRCVCGVHEIRAMVATVNRCVSRVSDVENYDTTTLRANVIERIMGSYGVTHIHITKAHTIASISLTERKHLPVCIRLITNVEQSVFSLEFHHFVSYFFFVHFHANTANNKQWSVVSSF